MSRLVFLASLLVACGGSGPEAPLENPVPAITALEHTAANAREAARITVTGTGFVASSQVTIDGTAATTTFKTATTLEALVPATSGGRTHDVLVRNPAPGGGVSASMQVSAQ